ncbi:MAG TPA: GNAT family N-acetyltransferase [Gemmatimonadaceae bacterium]|jgi:RimJ/RimL family protein N-acetyltransferase
MAPSDVDLRSDVASLHTLLQLAMAAPLTADAVDWPAVYRLAQRERLLGVAWKANAHVIKRSAPADVVARWQRTAVLLGVSVRQQLELLAESVASLANAGVDVVVLKGAPLAHRLYGDFTVRPTLDMDLYVPADQRARASVTLRELSWRHTAGDAPEEESFERLMGRRCFRLEVHSSALDDPLLEHVRFPVESRPCLVEGHVLPAHDGRFLPGYLAAHLAKHNEQPLLWAVDFSVLWSGLETAAKNLATDAAATCGLGHHLRWAVELAREIRASVQDDHGAGRSLASLTNRLSPVGDSGRVMRLVSLSDTPRDVVSVVTGRIWPAAWRQGWRHAPAYFGRRAVRWLYRHLTFERPSATAPSDLPLIRLAHDDTELRLTEALRSTPVWLIPSDGTMEPAIPRFAFARVRPLNGETRIGDVVLVRAANRGCVLRRIVSLGTEGTWVEADAQPKSGLLVPPADVLGICDVIDVNGRQVRIESRPHGNQGLLRAIVRSRFAAASHRLVYVFDFETSSVPEVASIVEFRELATDEIDSRRASLGAGGQCRYTTSSEGGCVIGTIGGQQVYHAWYIRGEATAVRGLPDGWRPSGRVLFLHDGVTEPAFRGQGIHSAATRWLLARERSMVTAHAVAVVHADNPAARRAVVKAGFRVVGRVD